MANQRHSFAGLVEGEDLERVARLRAGRKEFHQEPPAHADPDLLEKLTQHEISLGWEVDKSFKNRTRMFRYKSPDVQLEDDVWSLFYRMQFTALNKDRHFYINNAENVADRQVDIIAKDDGTIYFIECTHKTSPGRRSVTNLIEKFSLLRNPIRSQVQKSFENGKNLQIKMLIATRGIEWSQNDVDRAKRDGIGILLEEDMGYFNDLVKLLRGNSKYQLNARYFALSRNANLEKRVFASRIKVGDRTAYHFMASPFDILKIASVSHRARTSENDLKSYQRMVNPRRLDDIGKFISEGGTFPTNIVCNFKTKKRPRWDGIDKAGEIEYGFLTLPGLYGCLMVIDGQHRLYGYTRTEDEFNRDKSAVSILAYEGLSIEEEIDIFVDINTKQKKVATSLAAEIRASIGLNQEDVRDKIAAICTHVAQRLEQDPKSPFFRSIKSEMDRRNPDRIITLVNVSEGLRKHNLIAAASKGQGGFEFVPGPLSVGKDSPEANVSKAADVLVSVLTIIKEAAPGNWEKRDDEGGFWFTNTGYRTAVRLVGSVLNFLQGRDQFDAKSESAAKLVDRLRPYIRFAAEFIENGGRERAAIFRGRSGAGGVDQNARFLEIALCEHGNLSYSPKNIVDIISERDEEGTQDARAKIAKFLEVLRASVKKQLEELYDDDSQAWWFQGVPPDVQSICQQTVTKDKGKSEPWDHVGLEHITQIMEKSGNWRSFKSILNAKINRGAKKEQVLLNIKNMIPIEDYLKQRDATLSRTQVAMIEDFASLVTDMASELGVSEVSAVDIPSIEELAVSDA